MALIRPIPSKESDNYCISGYVKQTIAASSSAITCPLSANTFLKNFTISNNAITVGKSGSYDIKGFIRINTGQTTFPMHINVNGTSVATITYTLASDTIYDYNIEVSNISLSAGDVITITVEKEDFRMNPYEMYYFGITTAE